MRLVPWSQVFIGVADSMSKNSRYRENRDAGISNTFVIIRKLTNMGLSILYLKSSENLPKCKTAPMLR